MGTSPAAEAVRALAAAAAEEAGLVLEDVTVTSIGRRRVVRVVVDLPQDELGGVPMDKVAAASQALSAAMDRSDPLGGGAYVLEVSSPGVDRPLTQPRHYLRARGRLVRLALRDGRTASGRLVSVLEGQAVLDDGTQVPLSEVARGRVEIEFSSSQDPDEDAEIV